MIGEYRIGAVVIGRNEGERLWRCLDAFPDSIDCLVYVDSGSTDNSTQIAGDKGAIVVPLDTSRPFTAARARNTGARILREQGAFDLIQFVDGDCELRDGWVAAAVDFLDHNPRAAAVCGRLRERFPERSIYNALCDREWDTEPGQTKACGGIAMYRASAFHEANGFDDTLIAGEEPELCFRLRAEDWQIWRLDPEMAWHDAAMTRFSQWWKRARRGGYAFAQGAHMHGTSPERFWVRETRRAFVWGLGLPLVLVALSVSISPFFWAGFLFYTLQFLRLAWRHRHDKSPFLFAAFMIIGKFAEAAGVVEFWWKTLKGAQPQIIEYK
ncbi:glycosyltransferase [Roseovarius aestuariivivens]|uniref:glycosyltransferase n=1 Tax=Roseovarius aestuariivivens TaxID=1888910 RepID=UPI0010818F26|nr:glycosyltransferase family 2 protein [Roseovarius aestuariivivens]